MRHQDSLRRTSSFPSLTEQATGSGINPTISAPNMRQLPLAQASTGPIWISQGKSETVQSTFGDLQPWASASSRLDNKWHICFPTVDYVAMTS